MDETTPAMAPIPDDLLIVDDLMLLLRVRIRRVLEDGENPDPRTTAIIGLLFASGAMPSLRPPLPWTSTTVARAQQLKHGNWGAEAVATTVSRTAAAIVASTAAVTIRVTSATR